MIKHALNREWRKHELSKGERSSHFITLFTLGNDISDLSIHTSPMVMTLEEKPLFTTGVYDCFLVERDILQLIV